MAGQRRLVGHEGWLAGKGRLLAGKGRWLVGKTWSAREGRPAGFQPILPGISVDTSSSRIAERAGLYTGEVGRLALRLVFLVPPGPAAWSSPHSVMVCPAGGA
jgi:hypothetical protein